jgi:predicted unusual protein kinase regulating ubiquinone biosynthesis (AarF/ABC1/UbiB family)
MDAKIARETCESRTTYPDTERYPRYVASQSMADDSLPPSGRFSRFRKLATLSARLSADAVGAGIKKLTGQDEGFPTVSAERIVEALGEMKGLAMKLGQALSMDPQLLPPEARAVLARLQNQATPMPFETVAQVVTQELGKTPDDAFATFEREPLAAASIGQVHRATTHDGLDVVVKVQYPGIAEVLHSDFANLGTLVKALGAGGKRLDVRKHFEEIRADFLAEADYRNEARNARAFAEAVKGLPELHVPQPIEALTAERVLTLERLEGPTLKELLHQPLSSDERFMLGRQLTLATSAPFITHGLMHVDPHPGNYLKLHDGRLGILDFGNIKRFSPVWVRVNQDMLRFAVNGGPSINCAQLSHECGFDIDVPDAEMNALVGAMLDIIARPMREPTWDFKQDDTRVRLRALALKQATRFMKVKPPKEAPLFFRSIGGLWLNLVALEVKGPMRDVYKQLAALDPVTA